MGQVHAGFDTLLERRIAVKTLHESSGLDAQARARFRREALAAAALDPPFICKVYEVGEHDGKSFIVRSSSSWAARSIRVRTSFRSV